jgi:hypothetical protein
VSGVKRPATPQHGSSCPAPRRARAGQLVHHVRQADEPPASSRTRPHHRAECRHRLTLRSPQCRRHRRSAPWPPRRHRCWPPSAVASRRASFPPPVRSDRHRQRSRQRRPAAHAGRTQANQSPRAAAFPSRPCRQRFAPRPDLDALSAARSANRPHQHGSSPPAPGQAVRSWRSSAPARPDHPRQRLPETSPHLPSGMSTNPASARELACHARATTPKDSWPTHAGAASASDSPGRQDCPRQLAESLLPCYGSPHARCRPPNTSKVRKSSVLEAYGMAPCGAHLGWRIGVGTGQVTGVGRLRVERV